MVSGHGYILPSGHIVIRFITPEQIYSLLILYVENKASISSKTPEVYSNAFQYQRLLSVVTYCYNILSNDHLL